MLTKRQETHQLNAIFLNSCKKNIVLLSWGHSDSLFPGLFSHTLILTPTCLMTRSGFLMAMAQETTANFILWKPPDLHPQFQMQVPVVTPNGLGQSWEERELPPYPLESLTPWVFSHILPLWLHNLVPSSLSSLKKISCPRSHIVNPLPSTSS